MNVRTGLILVAAYLCLGSHLLLAQSPISHVVIIFQENRTPDNLFHGLPGADIASTGKNSLGKTITLGKTPLVIQYDLSHSHPSFLAMYDNGKMDGANKIKVTCKAGITCPPPHAQFKYVDPTQVAPYFQLAEQYTFGDRMFQTNQGPSFPAHQFIIAGTSAPAVGSDLFAAGNPAGPGTGKLVGCTADAGAYVKLIDAFGSMTQSMYPCFEHPTLMDLLDNQSISWRYYTPGPGTIWTGPNAISHLRLGADWNNVVLTEQVLTDISNGNLPAVSWVIPHGDESDHALSDQSGLGPSWVASVVNAIGNSVYWSNTAIFITWDDWGGWYDHVAPPVINSYEYGFRVPLIVVSPYAKPAYVSHVTHDFGSLLKFIETVFGLPSLGYADTPADDMSDCFDFTQPARPFFTIASQYSPSYFVNRKSSAADPDNE